MVFMSKPTQCPCGSKKAFHACCQVFISGEQTPPTAEALMRSRYSAYVLGDLAYIADTWYPHAPSLEYDADLHWLGLKILATSAGSEKDDKGMVHFRARYKVHGKGNKLEEISYFKRIQGRWYYIGAELDVNPADT
jgi:SEC-C motif-containing protein